MNISRNYSKPASSIKRIARNYREILAFWEGLEMKPTLICSEASLELSLLPLEE